MNDTLSDPGDARVPVFAGGLDQAGAEDAVLADPPTALPAHAAGCACCRPRPALARALARLFLARARGEVAFFRRVLVAIPPGGEAELAAAIAGDPVSAARFRYAGRLGDASPGSVASPSPIARCM
jgi:hypothetical protein